MEFHKMHGLGNDFIILNNLNLSDHDLRKLAIELCDRHTGIGADGIVLVLPSEKADIQMRILNSDGSEPNMCGNAIRCFSKFVFDNKIMTKPKFSVETLAGLLFPELILKNGEVSAVKVNMGSPKLNREDIPMKGAPGQVINEPITINNSNYQITSMLMTVPHTMIFIDNVDSVDVANIGRQIEKHSAFPLGTNVNFVQVINKNEIKVRTWERGVGLTLACGTGSCASVVAAVLNGKTEKNVTVHLLLGDLLVEWKNDLIYMTGPASYVFKGYIDVNN
jgi:diaminopimelate epimerase